MSDDHGSFDEFFRADYARLVAFVVKLGYGVPDAEDAAVEAMTELYLAWGAVRQPGAWVRLVARRAAARRSRREVRRVVREQLTRLPEATDDRLAAQVDDVLWLAEVLDALGPREREVLVLTLEGFTPRRIAELLWITPATVRSHLRHARDRLRGHPLLTGAAAEGRADG